MMGKGVKDAENDIGVFAEKSTGTTGGPPVLEEIDPNDVELKTPDDGRQRVAA